MKQRHKVTPVIVIVLEALMILLLSLLLIWQQHSLSDNVISDEELESLRKLQREEGLLKNEQVPFTFLSETECSLSPLVSWHYQEQFYNGKLVWWEEFDSEKSLWELEEKLSISVPAIDLKKYCLIVSAGRKIDALRACTPDGGPDPFGDDHLPIGCVTFSKEFFENRIFFYTVERPGPEESVFFPAPLHSIYFITGERLIGTSTSLYDFGE